MNFIAIRFLQAGGFFAVVDEDHQRKIIRRNRKPGSILTKRTGNLAGPSRKDCRFAAEADRIAGGRWMDGKADYNKKQIETKTILYRWDPHRRLGWEENRSQYDI